MSLVWSDAVDEGLDLLSGVDKKFLEVGETELSFPKRELEVSEDLPETVVSTTGDCVKSSFGETLYVMPPITGDCVLCGRTL